MGCEGIRGYDEPCPERRECEADDRDSREAGRPSREDSREDSKEDSKKDSREDSRKDSKEDSREDVRASREDSREQCDRDDPRCSGPVSRPPRMQPVCETFFDLLKGLFCKVIF